MLHVSVLVQGTCSLQLESERQQEAEEAARVHNEMQEAHTRLKRLDKNLKQLTTHQVHATCLVSVCLSIEGRLGVPTAAAALSGSP